ncbi:PilN domain-containing protein [Roseateles sp. BYS180W]
MLKEEISGLDAKIKDISTLSRDLEALKARQKAVESLQSDRNTPVRLLNDLAKSTPDGVYLTSVKQSSEQVVIAGVATSTERVSEFLRAVGGADSIDAPDLTEIKVGNVSANVRDQRRLFDFHMKVRIKANSPLPDAGVGGKKDGNKYHQTRQKASGKAAEKSHLNTQKK